MMRTLTSKKSRALKIIAVPFGLFVLLLAVNERTGFAGFKLLEAVATAGSVRGVNTLIDLGSNVNWRDCNGDSALLCAVEAGQTSCVKALVEKGADVNICVDWDGETPVGDAILADNGTMVKLLACHGAAIRGHGGDIEGLEMPLWRAAEWGHFNALKALITSGADLNARSGENETALMSAANSGDIDCVKVLLAAGANPYLKDDDGATALQMTDRPQIIKLLTLAMHK